MAQPKKPRLPLSGDQLVDALFKILIDMLETKINGVHLKETIHDTDKGHKELLGVIPTKKEKRIYLNRQRHKKDKEPLVKTLIHEVLHVALWETREVRIESLEKILFTRLTDAQKRYLKKYIPKHTVKHNTGDIQQNSEKQY